MSNDVVIRVENLSKMYRIRHGGAGARSGDGLRHALQDAASAPLRALKRSLSRKFKSEVSETGSAPLNLNLPSSTSAGGAKRRLSGKWKVESSDSDLNLNSPTSTSDDFWALRDVSFEVRRGEVLGIIGQNGAGYLYRSSAAPYLVSPAQPDPAANDLYADVLAIQNAARLQYPASQPGSEAARRRFLLEEFPPRDRSQPDGGAGPTPPAPSPQV